jgi:hypothetical protein
MNNRVTVCPVYDRFETKEGERVFGVGTRIHPKADGIFRRIRNRTDGYPRRLNRCDGGKLWLLAPGKEG